MSKPKTSQTRPSHHWRDNIEAVTVSIVIIVLFKYFVLEAYKIPTGSMQPTLMGWENPDGGGIFDRVLVDKLSFHYRDPERWEVVVFKYPLDRSKNFIKRIVGVPGEEMRIMYGDLVHRSDPVQPFQVLRRPRSVQRAMLKLLDSKGLPPSASRRYEWRVEGEDWRSENRRVWGSGPGRALFPGTKPSEQVPYSVRDYYTDGYPGRLASKLKAKNGSAAANEVGDLRLTGSLTAREDCREVRLEFREGSRTYSMIVPGPAAPTQARPAIRAADSAGKIESTEVQASAPWHLPAGRRVRFLAQNLDDLLELELAGEVALQLEIPAAAVQTSTIDLVTEGSGADFRDLRVYRDIYYTTAGQKRTSWTIPEGQYLMLGDNTQDSSDGRDWSLTGIQITDEDGRIAEIWGNDRPLQNPREVRGRGRGTTVFFHDFLGERWVFDKSTAETLPPRRAPFVPRELIRGRAVLVVWPVVPSLDVYRIKWVR